MSRLWSSLRGLFGKGSATRKADPADVFQSLRHQVLTMDPTALGLAPTPSNRVWAMLMETGYPTAVVSLVVIGDGTISLYISTGGGIIGAGAHEGPRAAGEELLAYAPAFVKHATVARDIPLPRRDHVRFTFLTFDGLFTVEEHQKTLEDAQHPLAPLFRKSHDVITHLRLLDELQRGSKERAACRPPTNVKPLLAAAAAGKIDVLAALLKAGASADAADDTGMTPLMAAARSGKEDIVEMLVATCSLDAQDASGYTALMFACNGGQARCVEVLLRHGANVNTRDKNGSTPLMFAAQHGHCDVVRLLLKCGANPNVVGTHGLSALGFAHQSGHRAVERLLKR